MAIDQCFITLRVVCQDFPISISEHCECDKHKAVAVKDLKSLIIGFLIMCVQTYSQQG